MINYVLVLLRLSDMLVAFKSTLRLSSNNKGNGYGCACDRFYPLRASEIYNIIVSSDYTYFIFKKNR